MSLIPYFIQNTLQSENDLLIPILHLCISMVPTSISDLRGHAYRQSENQTEYSLAIFRKLESYQARVSFTFLWKRMKYIVHQLWIEDEWIFKDHVKYILSLRIKESDWSGCIDCKICRRYYQYVATPWTTCL